MAAHVAPTLTESTADTDADADAGGGRVLFGESPMAMFHIHVPDAHVHKELLVLELIPESQKQNTERITRRHTPER